MKALKAPYSVFSHSRHSKHSKLSLCTCLACLQPPVGIHPCMHACEMTGEAYNVKQRSCMRDDGRGRGEAYNVRQRSRMRDDERLSRHSSGKG